VTSSATPGQATSAAPVQAPPAESRAVEEPRPPGDRPGRVAAPPFVPADPRIAWGLESYFAAQEAERAGDMEEALARYSEALEYVPRSPIYLQGRAELLHNLERYDRAIADCRAIIGLPAAVASGQAKYNAYRTMVECYSCLGNDSYAALSEKYAEGLLRSGVAKREGYRPLRPARGSEP
jgi:tetratricopeptide (TPR) repeat protein